MPHRSDPMNATSAGANGARHQGRGKGTEPKDSTGRAARNSAVATTPGERKSGWVRLADVISSEPWAEPDADPALRAILEAGLTVDAEEGDGAAAFLPGGETLLFHVSPDGLLVRRNVPAAEVALFLAGAREAA